MVSVRKIFFKSAVLVLGLGLVSQVAHALREYKLDTSHSEVGFSVRHLMVTNVRGRFNDFSGSFKYDAANREVRDVDVVIQAKSIDTNDKKRDDHLRNDDFFATDKFPILTFKATGPVRLGSNNKAKVPGNLTMRGVTKPVTLDVEMLGITTDPWGNEKLGFTAETRLNRQDYGVSWNKTLDRGGVSVGNEVRIMIEGQALLIKPEGKK